MIMSEDRDNIRELLSAYIDGEVTQEQSRSVEQAVATDPELALELHELNAAKRLVMGLARERAPRGFVRKVMARAERKHLLGDHQAGGSFGAARWITLAVAAVVLLTAGIGIIAVNMLQTGQGPSPIAKLDDGLGSADGPGNLNISGGSLHGTLGNDRDKVGEKAGVGDMTTGSGIAGGRLVVADAAFDLALRNRKNTSIYTHDVSNTLAVLNETLDRNNVRPLELEAPTEDSKPAGKAAAKKQNVSHGELNFYYNKKQDTEQVQIVVLATDTVIERLNGDLDKLARVQMVSQTPAPDLYKARPDGRFVARRTGPQETRQDADPSGRDEGGVVIARVDDDRTGLGVTSGKRKEGKGDGARSESKMIKEGVIDQPSGKKAPSPAVPPVTEIAKPVASPGVSGDDTGVRPSDIAGADTSVAAKPAPKPPGQGVSQTGNTGAADTDGEKDELAKRGGVPRPEPAKGLVTGPTTRHAESLQVAGGIWKDLSDNEDSSELEALSFRIAEQQKRGESNKELDVQYIKLNKAFRRHILNDDVRRNVQSQQALGVNVQALVININRRSLKSPGTAATQNGTLPRYGEALSRPGATTKSTPVSESTTRQATQPADTSR